MDFLENYISLKGNSIKYLSKSTKQKARIRVFSFHPSKKVVVIYHFMQKKSFLSQELVVCGEGMQSFSI